MKNCLGWVMNLHRKLSTAEYAIIDRDVALSVVMGLPEAYKSLIPNHEQYEGMLMTKKLEERLLVEEKCQSKREDDKLNKSEETNALMIKNKPTTQSNQLHECKG